MQQYLGQVKKHQLIVLARIRLFPKTDEIFHVFSLHLGTILSIDDQFHFPIFYSSTTSTKPTRVR